MELLYNTIMNIQTYGEIATVKSDAIIQNFEELAPVERVMVYYLVRACNTYEHCAF